MTYFLFAGDMLVMLFMVVVATWVFFAASDADIDATAQLPLHDEETDRAPNAD